MAVRFLPPSGADTEITAPDRENLAEVIDLRSRLVRVTAPAVPPEPTASRSAQGGAARSDNPVARLRAAVHEIESGAGSGATTAPAWASDGGAETGHDADGGDEAVSGAEGEDEAAAQGPARSAKEDGVRLLARKARSNGELRRELMQLGHDHGEVEAVLLEFETSLYLDDLGLARVVCESLRERKRASRSQIRMKLRERLIPDGVIEEVLSGLDDDEEFALLRTAAEDRAKKLNGLDRQTAERRLLGFLARRGWSGERASSVAREALDRASARGSVRFR